MEALLKRKNKEISVQQKTSRGEEKDSLHGSQLANASQLGGSHPSRLPWS
jgi:hypothetical protein